MVCTHILPRNNFGALLELPWWLLLAFCPKIFGDGGDLQMVLCQSMMQVLWWRYHNLVGTFKTKNLFEPFALTGSGMSKNFCCECLHPRATSVELQFCITGQRNWFRYKMFYGFGLYYVLGICVTQGKTSAKRKWLVINDVTSESLSVDLLIW